MKGHAPNASRGAAAALMIAVALIAAPNLGAEFSEATQAVGAAPPVHPSPVQYAQTTVWDGVYTEEQAKRGLRVYQDQCAACHLDSLKGDSRTQTPGLVGSPTAPRWKNITLKDLFVTIESSMPQNAPGSLGSQAYTDILSYLLMANGMPAGAAELPVDPEKLTQVRFTTKPASQ